MKPWISCAAAAALCLSSPTQAARVAYEVSGDMLAQFLPIVSDPVADLFGAPRNSISSVPATLRFVVDLDTTPTIVQDNSLSQEYLYSPAVVDATLTFNGVEFRMQRPLGPTEAEIKITNSHAANGLDAFELKLLRTAALVSEQDLFNSYTVPVNQTVNSQFIDDALVAPLYAQLTIARAGALDSAALPTDASAFDGATLFLAGTQIGAELGSFGGVTTFSGNGAALSFDIKPVPLPAAGWLLLGPLLTLFAVRRARR